MLMRVIICSAAPAEIARRPDAKALRGVRTRPRAGRGSGIQCATCVQKAMRFGRARTRPCLAQSHAKRAEGTRKGYQRATPRQPSEDPDLSRERRRSRALRGTHNLHVGCQQGLRPAARGSSRSPSGSSAPEVAEPLGGAAPARASGDVASIPRIRLVPNCHTKHRRDKSTDARTGRLA
jgi:hypothetical protein